MKPLQLIKTVSYILLGVAVLVFNKELLNYVGILVGVYVIIYACDKIVFSAIKKDLLGKDGLITALAHLLVAAALIMLHGDLEKICVIWAVWAILREGRELSECAHRIANKKPALIQAAVCVVVIALFFTMMLKPSLYYAHVHVVLMGAELILEVLLSAFYSFLDRLIDKKKTPDHTADDVHA